MMRFEDDLEILVESVVIERRRALRKSFGDSDNQRVAEYSLAVNIGKAVGEYDPSNQDVSEGEGGIGSLYDMGDGGYMSNTRLSKTYSNDQTLKTEWRFFIPHGYSDVGVDVGVDAATPKQFINRYKPMYDEYMKDPVAWRRSEGLQTSTEYEDIDSHYQSGGWDKVSENY